MSAAAVPAAPAAAPVYDMDVRTIKGTSIKFGELAKGKVTLVVNTASKCGFTGQYEGLQTLYNKYKDRGFTVVGFPCDQFGGQEPGSEAEIEEFTCSRFKVSFPMTAKVDVSGDKAHPLFKHLGKEKPGLMGREAPFWNFTKFLLNDKGEVVDRFAPTTAPESIDDAVAKLLPAAAPTAAA